MKYGRGGIAPHTFLNNNKNNKTRLLTKLRRAMKFDNRGWRVKFVEEIRKGNKSALSVLT
jgi:hypothetical protein